MSGGKDSGASATTAGMEAVAVAADKAGTAASGAGNAAKKAAKDIKTATTGIDELNILNPDSGSDSGSGSAVVEQAATMQMTLIWEHFRNRKI